MTIDIRLSGAALHETAASAQDMLREISGAEPERREITKDTEEPRGDSVAIIALIISIPAAVISTMDLVERAGIAERIRHFLKKAQKADGEVILHVDTEPPLDLKNATEDRVVDLIEKSGR